MHLIPLYDSRRRSTLHRLGHGLKKMRKNALYPSPPPGGTGCKESLLHFIAPPAWRRLALRRAVRRRWARARQNPPSTATRVPWRTHRYIATPTLRLTSPSNDCPQPPPPLLPARGGGVRSGAPWREGREAGGVKKVSPTTAVCRGRNRGRLRAVTMTFSGRFV